jgi:phosphoribosylformylglycinamidine cyclo-ligase
MAVIVSVDAAEGVAQALEGVAEEDVFEIGRVEEGARGCTVSGKAGTWNSPKDWSATHNA